MKLALILALLFVLSSCYFIPPYSSEPKVIGYVLFYPWSETKEYQTGDKVNTISGPGQFDRLYWVSLQDVNLGYSPPDNPDWWEQIYPK